MEAVPAEKAFRLPGERSTLDEHPAEPVSFVDALRVAASLAPDDRLRLIVRLWASLPEDHWAAPTLNELVEVERRLRDYEGGRQAQPPWELVQHILAKRPICAFYLTSPPQKIYSAPRRFDLFTVMIVTAAYAVLLSGMSALRFPPVVSCYVAAFITLVGMGQAVLFRGSMPRLASVQTGIVAYFLCTISYGFMEPRFDLFEFMPLAIVFAVIFGGILGYLAGVLVGGVFLVADVLRQRYGRQALESLEDSMPPATDALHLGDSQ
jgi:putative addiction module component (TIGR02574 family)